MRRAAATGAGVALRQRHPLAEPRLLVRTLAALGALRPSERSGWPRVEVVEPPRRGLPQRAIACLVEAARTGQRSLILLPRVEATLSGPGPEELAALVARVAPGRTITRADRPGLGEEPGALREALTGRRGDRHRGCAGRG